MYIKNFKQTIMTKQTISHIALLDIALAISYELLAEQFSQTNFDSIFDNIFDSIFENISQ